MEIINFNKIVNDLNESKRFLKSIKGPLVYRIYQLSSGKSYIGSTRNLYERVYCKLFGYYWKIIGENKSDISRIHRAIMRYGFSDFQLEVLEYHNSIDEAHIREAALISEYDSYFSGYNSTITGHWKNRLNEVNRKGVSVWITDGIDSRMINVDILDEFLKRGWRRGSKITSDRMKDTIFIHNDFETLRIHKNDLQSALNEGYVLGRGYDDPKLGRTVITDGFVTLFVKDCQLSDYLDRGFYLGKDESTKSHMRNKLCMTNGVKDIRVDKSDTDKIFSLIESGFYIGRKYSENRHLRYITNINNFEIRRVPQSDLEQYLNSDEWIQGRKTKIQVQRLLENQVESSDSKHSESTYVD